jgi:hypothetical protein
MPLERGQTASKVELSEEGIKDLGTSMIGRIDGIELGVKCTN